jgi:hypothetical protein
MGGDQRRLADELKARLAAAQELGARPARGMSFNHELVVALIEGRKTQTRRPVRPVSTEKPSAGDCPLASVGERLLVREKWAQVREGDRQTYVYAADGATTQRVRWQAGRYMPADAGKRVIGVRSIEVQRVQAISEVDARAEGVPADWTIGSAVDWFRGVWDSIYGETEVAWGRNPWVWCVGFELER